MLIYHPAFDASHCAHRIIKIFKLLDQEQSIESEKIQIIDFYLVFPKKVGLIKYPRKFSSIKRATTLINDVYRPCRNPYLILQKMRIIQKKVLSVLVINKYIFYNTETNTYSQGEKFRELNLNTDDYLFSPTFSPKIDSLILEFFLTTPLNGKNGVKDRTSLMEFRYDI